jgi:excisionase family DNA binding protein
MSATLTIPEVAELLGVSRNSAYEAARSGSIAGVPVISVGRRLLLARKPLMEVLGIDEDPTEAGSPTESFGPDYTGPTSQSHAGTRSRHDTD